MQLRTGARVRAMDGDAEALESGHDTSATSDRPEAVPVSRRLKRRGYGLARRYTLRAIKHPADSQGATIGQRQSKMAAHIYRRLSHPHPLLNGADAWKPQLAVAEPDFERRVAQEQPRR